MLRPLSCTSCSFHALRSRLEARLERRFNQPNGSAPDPAKWTAVTGGSSWGNQELKFYTSRPENVHLENGNLVITARMEAYTGRDNVQRPSTSGRLQTKGKFEQREGRFEARIKIPSGECMWPAFWMLGNYHYKVGWPACARDRHYGKYWERAFHGAWHTAWGRI